PSHFFLRNLNAATITNNALIPDSLILSAMTFVIFYRPKNTLTEQSVTFRFISTVVDGFWFDNFPARSFQYRLRRGQTDRNGSKITFYFAIFLVRHTLYLPLKQRP